MKIKHVSNRDKIGRYNPGNIPETAYKTVKNLKKKKVIENV